MVKTAITFCVTNFFNMNGLTINQSKTVLQEHMLKQKRCKIKGEPPHLDTLDDKGNFKRVNVSRNSIMLGGSLQDDLQLSSHIKSGEEPLLSDVRKKLGALKYLGKNLPKKKILLANRLILSEILYLLPLYGGMHGKYLNKIQVTMNNTLRFITGLNKIASNVQETPGL